MRDLRWARTNNDDSLVNERIQSRKTLVRLYAVSVGTASITTQQNRKINAKHLAVFRFQSAREEGYIRCLCI